MNDDTVHVLKFVLFLFYLEEANMRFKCMQLQRAKKEQ